MPLKMHINMSTTKVIKLAEKIDRKYSLVSFAGDKTDQEAARIIDTIRSGTDIIKQMAQNRVAGTFKLMYSEKFGEERKIILENIIWAQDSNAAWHNFIRDQFIQRALPILNKTGMNFEDGPWSITIPTPRDLKK